MKNIHRIAKTIRFVLILTLLGSPITFIQAQDTTRTCSSDFEFSVSFGPSAPLTLAGTLTMNIEESGAFAGTLAGFEGPLVVAGKASLPDSLPVIGQVNGHAINMLIDISDEQTIFGSGAAEADLSSCNGEMLGLMGGPAAGPQVGDVGDWLTRCRKFKDPDKGCD
jgi:hypothetical protein